MENIENYIFVKKIQFLEEKTGLEIWLPANLVASCAAGGSEMEYFASTPSILAEFFLTDCGRICGGPHKSVGSIEVMRKKCSK